MCNLIDETQNRHGIAQIIRVLLFNYRYCSFTEESFATEYVQDLDDMIYAFKAISGQESNIDREKVKEGLKKFCDFMIDKLPV